VGRSVMEEKFLKTAEFYFFKIRNRLLRVVFVFLLGAVLGMIFYQKIFQFLISCFNFQQTSLVLTSPSQAISLILSVGFLTGVLLAFPFLIFQFLNFIRPALTAKEYQLLKKLVLPSFFLLLLGLIYGIYVMRAVIFVYATVPFGIKIQRFWQLSDFLSQIVFLSAAMGLLFQLPVVLSVLLNLDIVKREVLAQKRKYIYGGLLILAVLLPPTDPLSLLILVLPLFIMFESALLLNKKGGEAGV